MDYSAVFWGRTFLNTIIENLALQMGSQSEWCLFNVDSLVEELTGDQSASTIDLCVASLAFRNFDFVTKRLPFTNTRNQIEKMTFTRRVSCTESHFSI